MFEINSLSNNLKFILVPQKGVYSVSFLVLVKIGTKYETKKIEGISHFIEHMVFKGTKRRPQAFLISKEIEGMGGEFNAFTSKNFTGFWIKIPQKKEEIALDLLVDILRNPLFDEKEIEKERQVILEEIKMTKDTPTKYIHDLWENLIFEKTPLGFDILGNIQTVSQIKREDLLSFFEKFYTASNMVLAVAGNFQKKIKKKIEKYFGKIKKGKSFPKKLKLSFKNKKRFLFYQKETNETHLGVGVRCAGAFSKEKYPLSLLALILGGNMSSRLFQKIREKEGLCYYISTDYIPYPEIGSLVTFLGTSPQFAKKALSLIIEEYEKIKKEGVSENELQRAKEYLKGKILLSLEDTEEIAHFYGTQLLLEKKILTPEKKIKEIEKVKKEDIKKCAQKYFKKNSLFGVCIGKEKINEGFF